MATTTATAKTWTTYPITSTALYDAMAASRKALHDIAGLRLLFPTKASWNNDDGSQTSSRADDESIAEAVSALQADGLVEVWASRPKGWAVLLSTLAAERLEIELDKTGSRWQPIGGTHRKARLDRRNKVRSECEIGIIDLDQIPDRHKFDFASIFEAGNKPSVLLGIGQIWNGPIDPDKPRYRMISRTLDYCPGCASSPITANRTCLMCDDRCSEPSCKACRCRTKPRRAIAICPNLARRPRA